MSFFKKYKATIISVICIIALLAFAFFCTGTDEGTININTDTHTETQNEGKTLSLQSTEKTEESSFSKEKTEPLNKNENIEQKQPEKTGNADAKSEQNISESKKNELTCTLSVRCDNALLKEGANIETLPSDGIIFAECEVVFYEGESVFNVLLREMKKNKIHFEYVDVPIYNSAYIEGINNLYEFDLGELSGWMYKVNGIFPNYGCSKYTIKKDDKIEWVYTCDLGKDVGGEYSARNGMTDE